MCGFISGLIAKFAAAASGGGGVGRASKSGRSPGKRGNGPSPAPMFTGAWLSSVALTATSLPCQLIVIAEFCGASSRLSLMPLDCILAITHLSASTLFLLFVTCARSVMLSSNVGRNDHAVNVESATIDLKDGKCTGLNSIFYKR